MKTKTLLIAAVMFFGISVAAFAQATYTVGQVAAPTLVTSGHTEKVGDLTFTTIPTSESTITGTIAITYSSAVTYKGTIVPVPEEGAPGNLPSFNILPAAPLPAGTKTLTITITPYPGGAGDRYYGFRLTGVRVDVANQPGAAPLTGTIETTGNGIVVGQNNVTVANKVEHGIDAFTINTTQAFNTLGTQTAGTGTAALRITEKFITAWGFRQQDDTTQSISQMIKIQINEAIPAGITITFPQYDSAQNFELYGANGITPVGGTQALISTSNPRAVYYRIIRTTNQIALDDFRINVTVAASTSTLPIFSPTTLTASATLALVSTDFTTEDTTSIPRYAADLVSADKALVTIASAYVKTTLMIPYATTEVGYDTGIAIANTTVDPGASAIVYNTAVPQDGKIAFYFYPNSGDPFSAITTAASVKTSLQAQTAWVPLTDAGLLERGRSYAVMLSQLLKAAGKPADYTFHGYIIVVTDFTNAHGQYFLSDWKYFTNGAQMLVITANRDAVPEDSDH